MTAVSSRYFPKLASLLLVAGSRFYSGWGVSRNAATLLGNIIPNPGFDEAERKFIAVMAGQRSGMPGVTLFRRPMLTFVGSNIPMLFSSTPYTLPF